jgi:hypothetical protein
MLPRHLLAARSAKLDSFGMAHVVAAHRDSLFARATIRS